MKLVTTSIIIYKKGFLTYDFVRFLFSLYNYRLKDIRAGINAFTLMEKELKETNIPLKEAVILSTLRVCFNYLSYILS